MYMHVFFCIYFKPEEHRHAELVAGNPCIAGSGQGLNLPRSLPFRWHASPCIIVLLYGCHAKESNCIGTPSALFLSSHCRECSDC